MNNKISPRWLLHAAAPIAVLLFATWLSISFIINAVFHSVSHEKSALAVLLYERSNKIVAEHLSGQKPCDADAECEDILDTIKTAFQHPNWYSTYQNYKALPSVYMRLLTPLPFSQRYMIDVLNIDAAFSLARLEKTSPNGMPAYDMDDYHTQIDAIKKLTSSTTVAILGASAVVVFFWSLLVFAHFKSLFTMRPYAKEIALNVAAWTATKHSVILLAALVLTSSLTVLLT